MPEGFIQLPADSSGKKLLTQDEGAAGHIQFVAQRAKPTYTIIALDVVAAGAKHHLTIHNGLASGKIIRVKKLFYIHTNIAAVVGAPTRFEVKRSTASVVGTAIPTTGSAVGAVTVSDSDDAALPATILITTGSTVTEANTLYPLILTSEESVGTTPLDKASFWQSVNLIPESVEVKEQVLREGQGITVKQITANTLGVYSWLAVITAE